MLNKIIFTLNETKFKSFRIEMEIIISNDNKYIPNFLKFKKLLLNAEKGDNCKIIKSIYGFNNYEDEIRNGNLPLEELDFTELTHTHREEESKFPKLIAVLEPEMENITEWFNSFPPNENTKEYHVNDIVLEIILYKYLSETVG